MVRTLSSSNFPSVRSFDMLFSILFPILSTFGNLSSRYVSRTIEFLVTVKLEDSKELTKAYLDLYFM